MTDDQIELLRAAWKISGGKIGEYVTIADLVAELDLEPNDARRLSNSLPSEVAMATPGGVTLRRAALEYIGE